MEKERQIKGLDRYLSKIDVWAMAFGCMVGWGAFVMPGTTFLPVAGPAGTLISQALGLVVMLMIAFSISGLMIRSPRTGGVYSYTKEAFGRDHAFLCSWFLCLSYLTIVFLNGTALFLVIRTVVGDKIEGRYYYEIGGNPVYYREVIFSVIALAGVGVLFIIAKPLLQKLQTILAILLLAGVVITAFFCLPRVMQGDIFCSYGYQGTGKAFAIFSLVILAPWAFVGFEVTSLDTAHFRFPTEKTRRVIFLSIILAAFVYSSMTLVSLSSIPDGYGSWVDYIRDLQNLEGVASVPTFYAAERIMGPVGLGVMTVTAFAAILTGIIGAYRAGLRVLSTMAEDKILSEHFSKTSYSILFIMIISIMISFLGRNTLNWFVDLTSFGAIVAYGYTSAAAWKIARMENRRGIMITGMAGMLISIIFGVAQLIPRLTAFSAMSSEAFLLLSLWCLLGFVFYWRTVRRSNLADYSGMSASGTTLFALLLYAAIMWMGTKLASCEEIRDVRSTLRGGGILLLAIIFIGLLVMLYIQDLVRTRHEAAEREKIRAVEGNLAKSRFLFNMSHDIRTPMNAIMGYINLAKKEPASDTIKDYLSKIENSSNHLLDLINDILEMSRIESGKLELDYKPTDLDRIFEGIRELFDEQMRQKQIDFSIYSEQIRHRYIWCDEKNLNRVLINIISNAYKFTPEGGTVSVSIYESGVNEDGCGSYEIRVRDTGIGMSKEFVDRMWGAFERERTSTDSGIEGTGLGLSITKSIVDLMGGTSEVLTSPGSGTQIILRFLFRLVTEEELERENAAVRALEQEEVSFIGNRALLVEDNAVNLEIARMILEEMDLEVETALNGQEALDKVSASEAGYYDVILMDIQMPVMDGYTATKKIREIDNPALSTIPILAMTANAFREDIEAAFEAGMQAHIAKPIDIGILRREIAKVLKKE